MTTRTDYSFLVVLLLAAIIGAMIGQCIKAKPALAADFYQWTDSYGTACFTDDPKAIPRAYRDAAVLRSFDSLPPIMPLQESRYPYVSSFGGFVESQRSLPGPAQGFVTIERQRVQEGPYNRPYYTVREGGRVISVTRQQPRVVINR